MTRTSGIAAQLSRERATGYAHAVPEQDRRQPVRPRPSLRMRMNAPAGVRPPAGGERRDDLASERGAKWLSRHFRRTSPGSRATTAGVANPSSKRLGGRAALVAAGYTAWRCDPNEPSTEARPACVDAVSAWHPRCTRRSRRGGQRMAGRTAHLPLDVHAENGVPTALSAGERAGAVFCRPLATRFRELC
jgi:hypothetical protein